MPDEVSIPSVNRPIADTQVIPGRISIVKFAFILAQLALLALIIRQFQIESPAFVRLALLSFAGFALHAWLPLRWRLVFFVVLSLGGIVSVLGPREGGWLLALGGLLLGICHLRIPFWARIVTLLAVAGGLAALRVEMAPVPWSRAVWPILASMFMFRIIVYLYD
jgi:hypothetical protein